MLLRPRASAFLMLGLLSLSLAGCSASVPRPVTSASDAPAPSALSTMAPSSAATDGLTPFGTLPDGSQVVLLAWNDLGMHCFNEDFSSLGILPPYNNLYAQVIRRGEDPKPVMRGITVEYRYPQNTYSVGGPGKPQKSNFWTYAEALFGVKPKPDIGLTGRGLSGSLDATGNHYVAQGIPVTDYRDQDVASRTLYPYQLARVTVRDSNGKAVAALDVVTPVSTEMRCDTCHANGADACKQSGIKETGNTYLNILCTHDKLNAAAFAKLGFKPLMQSRPVLCASCHSSNALGAAGKPGISSMSNAMHKRHSTVEDIKPTTEGCQNCHPGPTTRCLRDVHAETLGFGCPTCHGDLKKVAANTQPWLNEPRCDAAGCHKNTPGALLKQDKALYRQSVGHHGGVIMCEACHDSTHALAKSRETNDNLKFVALQGDAGYLRKCAVCHNGPAPDGVTKAHAQSD